MRAELVRILLAASIVNVSACAQGNAEPESLARAGASAGLEGKWIAIALPGNRGPPWIELRNGEVDGHAGCNAFGGTYTIAADGRLAFGRMTASKKLCMGAAMESESRVLEALSRTADAKLEGDRLDLRDSRKTVLLQLQRAR